MRRPVAPARDPFEPVARPRRVLLVQPGREKPGQADIAYVDPLPPPGLAYVAGAVRAAGHATGCIDASAERLPLAEVVARARAFAPDVVGFTAYSSMILDAAATAKALRAALPDAKMVLGGYHVSADPETTLRQFPVFDFAVFDEGEHALLELLLHMDDPRACGALPGVCARDGAELRKGPPREKTVALDSLPLPAFDLLPLDVYRAPYLYEKKRALTLTTARGCPYKCIFCQNPGGLLYRHHSIDRTMAEIERNVRDLGTQAFYITDETFTLNKKRATAFCEAMIAHGFHEKTRWFCETRVDAVDRPLLALMKKAGCYVLFYGVESGSQGLLDSIQKKIDKQEALNAVRWAQAEGIFTHTNFIFGHPHETRRTILETIDFALELDSDASGFHLMVPYPGTEVQRMARAGEGGYRLLSDDWDQYAKIGGTSLELEDVPHAMMQRLQLYAYARFYLRPRRLVNLPRVVRLGTVPGMLARIVGKQVASLASFAAR